MEKKQTDMEVTPQRAQMIRNTLVKLWADQYGVDPDTVKITKLSNEKPV